MITRRGLLVGCGASLALPGRCWCQTYSGCTLTAAEIASETNNQTMEFSYVDGQSPVSTSGDKDFDYALAQTLNYLSNLFDVLPGFTYLDDAKGKNAYASPANYMGRSDGTVLFGLRFLQEFLNQPAYPAAYIAAVCAHEFGHIAQYKYGIDDRLGGQPTVKRIELHADYLAGYFAGRRKLDNENFPAATIALAQFSVGDHAVDHPGHHGTPDERGNAVKAGFLASYHQRLAFKDALEAGVGYVQTL
ncbi:MULTISPECIES: metalloprotease [Agrobacterium tumefaciens complex]|uniref:Metalloprotease n=1 Tax=Agrobacterium genomosp. 13 str. CFBP 6927 TaxID=1183428 RepID=A0ABM9VIM6_9HYPH|nr:MULTISPECIES: metalloprotease [Agrobacterium tumefaciens complex]CDN94046.1 Metalloprotease [Agrobacterium tumefaciens]CUX45527.1 Metalloprotease [Agrobacterium genomosp. 13 str. CFBP 6927]